MMRCLERLLRRAGLKLRFSEGFHPKPRMSFPSALALGIKGTDEVMELQLAELISAEELLPRLASHAPPGLSVRSAEVLADGAPKARLHRAVYEAPVPPERRSGLDERIAGLLERPSWVVDRPKRREGVELRPQLEALRFHEGVLQMRLLADEGASASPRDVLAALELDDLESRGVHLTRTVVEIEV